jgi:hypothetical protein
MQVSSQPHVPVDLIPLTTAQEGGLVQSQSGRGGKRKYLPLLGIEPRSSSL